MITYTDPALVTRVTLAPAHRSGQTEYLICYDGHRRRVHTLNATLYVRVGVGIEFLDPATEWLLTGYREGEPPPPPDVTEFVPGPGRFTQPSNPIEPKAIR